MTSPMSYYLKLNKVISNFNSQCRTTLPVSQNQLSELINDPNYNSTATNTVKANIATLQLLIQQASETLAQIDWSDI